MPHLHFLRHDESGRQNPLSPRYNKEIAGLEPEYAHVVRTIPEIGFLFGRGKTFVEHNNALSLAPTELQGKDVFLRNAFMGQFR